MYSEKGNIIVLSLLHFDAFKDEGILVIPTVADPPPKLGGKEILSQDYQSRALSLLSIASISGCCQVKSHLCETCIMLSVGFFLM